MRGSKMSRAILAGSISIFRADNLYQPCNGGDHHFNQHFYLNCPKNTYNSQPSAFSTNHLSSTIPNQNHPTPTKKKITTSNSPNCSPKSPSCAQRRGSRAPAVQTSPVVACHPRRLPLHCEGPPAAGWPLTTRRGARTRPSCLGRWGWGKCSMDFCGGTAALFGISGIFGDFLGIFPGVFRDFGRTLVDDWLDSDG